MLPIQPPAPNPGPDSTQELESTVITLRTIICELLHANQKLRETLLKAKIDLPEKGTF